MTISDKSPIVEDLNPEGVELQAVGFGVSVLKGSDKVQVRQLVSMKPIAGGLLPDVIVYSEFTIDGLRSAMASMEKAIAMAETPPDQR